MPVSRYVISRRNEQKLLPTKGSNESEKTFSGGFEIRDLARRRYAFNVNRTPPGSRVKGTKNNAQYLLPPSVKSARGEFFSTRKV